MKKKLDEVEINTYLSDETKGVKDEFGIHTQIAETLTNKVLSANVERNSFTIGLLGEWGSGKSLIIDKVREKVEKHNNISFTIIDAWRYNGLPLLRHILTEIVSQLPGCLNAKEKETLKKRTNETIMVGKKFESAGRFKKAFDKIMLIIAVSTSILAIISSFIRSNVSSEIIKEIIDYIKMICTVMCVPSYVLKIFSTNIFSLIDRIIGRIREEFIVVEKKVVPVISPEQFEDLFNEILKKMENKGVEKHIIVFDNIDRCRPEFAYEVLSTIKTYLDKPNCIYLIPCDDVALRCYLDKQYCENTERKERDFSGDFLDKLFTTFFRIPPINELARDEFINKCLNSTVLKDLPKKEKIIQVLYYAYKGETPRQIKKFVNDFISYYEIAQIADPDRCFLLDDIFTFAVMVAIKQISPEYEKKLILNPEIIYEDSGKNGDRVENMIRNLHFKFPKEKSVLSYVYFKDIGNEQLIIDNLRDGKEVEITGQNLKSIRNLILNDINDEKEAFLLNDTISICSSIMKYGTDSFINNSSNDVQEIIYLLNKGLTSYRNISSKILDFQGENSEKVIDLLKIFFRFEGINQIKQNLFNDTLNNYDAFFNVIAKNSYFDFSNEIKMFINEIDFLKGDISDKEYSLLSALINNNRVEFFETSVIEKISQGATFENNKLRKIERDIFNSEKLEVVELIFEKLESLSSGIVDLISEYGSNLKLDTNNFIEKIEFLLEYSNLPVNKLFKVGEYDEDNTLNENLSKIVAKLHRLNFEKQSEFIILAIKLLGANFVLENLENISEADLINQIDNDEKLLDKVFESDELSKHLIEDDNNFKMIFNNTSKEWKIKNISKMMLVPTNVNRISTYLNSEEMLNEKVVKEKIINMAILSIEDIDEEDSVIIFDKILSKYSDISDNLLAGEKTFQEIDRKNIALSLQLLDIFKKHNIIYNDRLESLMTVLPEHIKNNNVSENDSINISNKIEEMVVDDEKKELLIPVMSEAISETNKEHIVKLGLSCLKKLADNGIDLAEKYKSVLTLIKDKGILQTDISEILGEEKVHVES